MGSLCRGHYLGMSIPSGRDLGHGASWARGAGGRQGCLDQLEPRTEFEQRRDQLGWGLLGVVGARKACEMGVFLRRGLQLPCRK